MIWPYESAFSCSWTQDSELLPASFHLIFEILSWLAACTIYIPCECKMAPMKTWLAGVQHKKFQLHIVFDISVCHMYLSYCFLCGRSFPAKQTIGSSSSNSQPHWVVLSTYHDFPRKRNTVWKAFNVLSVSECYHSDSVLNMKFPCAPANNTCCAWTLFFKTSPFPLSMGFQCSSCRPLKTHFERSFVYSHRKRVQYEVKCELFICAS